jgi:preprotein translocase subunit YajC
MAQLIVLVGAFAAMYVLLIMPQQKKVKAQRAMLGALEVGDPILTSGGIYGVVTDIEGEAIFLEVAPDIELKVARSAISAVLREVGPADDDTALEPPAPGVSPRSAAARGRGQRTRKAR